MKSRIVADGRKRLYRSPEFQARLRELQRSIQSRYAAELVKAGFIRRCVLRWRMSVEYRHERQKLIPSADSLFSHQMGSKPLPMNGRKG